MRKQIRRIISLLAAQFLLGMALNLIGAPTSQTSAGFRLAYWAILALHIFVALGLAGGAIRLWRERELAPPRQQRLITRSVYALAVAFISGILTIATPWSDLFSFLMAAGFLGMLVNMAFLYAEPEIAPVTPRP